MDQDYFEDNPLDADSSIDAYTKLTVVEATASKVIETNIDKKIIKPPKPIMLKNISDAEDFAAKKERDCDTDFLVEISVDWIKIIANNFATKS